MEAKTAKATAAKATGEKVKTSPAKATPAKAAAKAPPVPAAVLAPPVAPQPLDAIAQALKGAGDAFGKAVEDAAHFVGRFASDAKFRDETLFGAVEVAQAAEAVVCTLAAVTNDPNVKWLCGRAQVLARGAEDLRRRTSR